jgi:hypothetical protein
VAILTLIRYGSVVIWSLFAKYSALSLVYFLSGDRCCWDRDCSDNSLSGDWIDQMTIFGENIELDIGGGCDSTHSLISNGVYISFVLCGVLSAVINEVYLIRTLASHKRDLRKMFQGKFLVDVHPSAENCILGCLQYTGLQIAYVVFGWIIGTGFLVLLCLLVTFTTILPYLHIYGFGFWNWIFDALIFNSNTSAPGLFVVAAFNFIALWLFVRFIIQHSPGSVAITHRFRVVYHFVSVVYFIIHVERLV